MIIKLLINYIGFLAPGILFFISLFFLYNKFTFLGFLSLGAVVNNILNIILKLIIREPRPLNHQKTLEIALANGEKINFDKYGMPSAHAQNCGFFTSFITFVLKNPFITSLYTVISCISLYQRYIYKNHTILQLIIGFIVGIIFGYITYVVGEKYLIKTLTPKKDDNFFG
jgi:membrane-associated phospholipid phosphatase